MKLQKRAYYYSNGSFYCAELFLLHLAFKTLLVKLGVEGIEVLFVELVGEDSEVLAEALIVHNLALTQEADSVLDVGVVSEAKDVVVGCSGFLLP